ncbi:MAG: dihydroorotate dehydrogenase electron transfer subunit [Lachnospiraceae bacterium]|nr:dihydroorotate dehydrogenase electron transfer subunit [Lachnospiraceae bacterium]
MKDTRLTIISNKKIALNTFEMKLRGDLSDVKGPGQFVNFALEGKYLRRPISICDVNGDELTVIYKAVGQGTEQMSEMQPCQGMDTLVALGNGYDTAKSGERPLLIGGGAGIPPMYFMARTLISEGKDVSVILGFNTKDEIFYVNEFEALGCRVTVATADGSVGVKGFVTDALKPGYTYFYTCGPEPMLRAVYARTETSGQFSFEERMGCGFGACMGCSCRTVTGYKRICKDGPVLEKEEILWTERR